MGDHDISASSVPRLRLRRVSKRFGTVHALQDVSLDVTAGRVHGLLGENGAGKSTLIALLTGLHRPDQGTIELEGERVTLASPTAAIRRGIAVVAQHSALIPTMTVLENLMLTENVGSSESRFLLSRRGAARRLDELGELFGTDIAPHTMVGDLGLGQQQQIEIARALWQRPRILILDEPTSLLTAQEVDVLMGNLERLATQGTAVVLVTHKLHEAQRIADEVTVLRSGTVTARLSNTRLSELGAEEARGAILTAMFGDAPDAQARDPRPAQPDPSRQRAVAAPILTLEHVVTSRGSGGTPLDGCSLAVRPGECVGVAGIDGNGQRHLAEVIAGQKPPRSGSLTFKGREIGSSTVRARQRLGIRYVTDDRLEEGIFGRFSVALNLLAKRVGDPPMWRRGFTDRRAVRAEARRLIEDGDVRTPSLETPAGTLSGGNIQRILLARELDGDPKFVVFHQPSAGLDLRTVQRVHRAIEEFVAAGGAALVISSDLDELLSLSHRIVVVSRGRIVGDVDNHPREARSETRSAIAALITSTTPERSEAA